MHVHRELTLDVSAASAAATPGYISVDFRLGGAVPHEIILGNINDTYT